MVHGAWRGARGAGLRLFDDGGDGRDKVGEEVQKAEELDEHAEAGPSTEYEQHPEEENERPARALLSAAERRCQRR